MIVRIASEGQYVIPDDQTDRLDELDNAAVHACESGDRATFHRVFDDLLAFVRSAGTEVGPGELVGSDMIVPPADVSFEEACAEFSGEGLLPNP
jgi:hypothetical protein